MSAEVLSVYRHELKYFVPKQAACTLRALLSSTLQHDAFHAGDYWIRSLYFDTPGNRDYEEKQIGVSQRKKIRLRIYRVDTDFVKLEVKNRFGLYMLKETASLSPAAANRLIAGDLEVLRERSNPVLAKVYALMRAERYKPAVLVDYEREAYQCPFNEIRITFDKDIRASRRTSLFDPAAPMLRVMHEPLVCMEVKYNHMLPRWIADLLSSQEAARSSISKYCLARQTLY